MSQRKSFLTLSVLFLLSLSGLRAEEEDAKWRLQDLAGKYQGYLLIKGEKKKLTGELSLVRETNLKGQLQLEMAEVSGTSKPQKFQIEVQKKKYRSGAFRSLYKYHSLSFKSSFVPSLEEAIPLKVGCVEGQKEQKTIKLCLYSTKISLTIKGGEQSEDLDLQLQKGDDLPALAEGEEGHQWTLDELVGRARFSNYTVAQEAERVFQAKKGIRVSRGNLLPRFNVRDILNFVTGGPLGLVDSIGNFLPFIFPSNWFRLRQSKDLYQAESKSFASLRGNEMLNVQGFYYAVQRDALVLQMLEKHTDWLRSIQNGIIHEEEERILPTGSSQFFERTISMVEQDVVNLQSLVQDELSSLAQSVGLSPLKSLRDLKSIKFETLPTLENVKKIDPQEFYLEAQEKSFEIKALKFLRQAATSGTRSQVYGFLDPSSEETLGFATPAKISIGRSQVREINRRIEETLGLIQVRSQELSNLANKSIDLYRLTSKTQKAQRAAFEQLLNRHLVGDDTLDEWDYVEELGRLGREMIEIESQKITSVLGYLMAKGKMDRLLLKGLYHDLEAVLPMGPINTAENSGGTESSGPVTRTGT